MQAGRRIDEPGDVGDRRGVQLDRAGGGIGRGGEDAEVDRRGALGRGGGAIDVEGGVGRIVGEQAPGQEDASVRLVDGGEAAAERLDLGGGGKGGKGEGGAEQRQSGEVTHRGGGKLRRAAGGAKVSYSDCMTGRVAVV